MSGQGDTLVKLVKRHGTHVHFLKANEFAGVAAILLVIYSLTALASTRFSRVKTAVRILQSPVFLVIFWTGLCLWGILSHFNSAPIQLARRCGQLSMAASTISVFLAMKPALLPRTYQVPLTMIHKWVGRSAIVFALFHGIVYIVEYSLEAKRSSKEKRHGGHHHHLFSLFNVFGMVSLSLFLIIFIVSLGPVRRRAYAVFYALHWPLVTAIYILMIWHARPNTWLMVAVGLTLLALQAILRIASSRPVRITKVELFGPNLKLVTFEPAVPQAKLKGLASHVRLSTPLLNPLTWIRPSHPYTMIGNQTLVVRQSRFRIVEESTYSLCGPFPAPVSTSNYSNVVVIAGGSGVSVLPAFAAIPDAKVNLVWVTRHRNEVELLKHLNIAECDVYVTGTLENSEGPDDYELQEFTIDDDYDETVGDEEALLDNRPSLSVKGLRQFSGRPSLAKLKSGLLNDVVGPVLVVACGPETLVNDVERWAAQSGYDFWAEIFAL